MKSKRRRVTDVLRDDHWVLYFMYDTDREKRVSLWERRRDSEHIDQCEVVQKKGDHSLQVDQLHISAYIDGQLVGGVDYVTGQKNGKGSYLCDWQYTHSTAKKNLTSVLQWLEYRHEKEIINQEKEG